MDPMTQVKLKQIGSRNLFFFFKLVIVFSKSVLKTQVHKRHTRDIQEKYQTRTRKKIKKKKKKHERYKNESNSGKPSIGKGYWRMKLLIPTSSSHKFQDFDHFLLSKCTTSSRTVPSSTQLHYENYQTALSKRQRGLPLV